MGMTRRSSLSSNFRSSDFSTALEWIEKSSDERSTTAGCLELWECLDMTVVNGRLEGVNGIPNMSEAGVQEDLGR